MSVSVMDLAMHPKTTSPRGCNAGLYRKAKLLAKSVHCCSHLQLGTEEAHNSMISSRASVMSAKESNDKGSRSGGDMVKLRSAAPENRSLCVRVADLKAVVAADWTLEMPKSK